MIGFMNHTKSTNRTKKIFKFLLIALLLFSGIYLYTAYIKSQNEPTVDPVTTIREDGQYNSKEDVSLYLHLYGKLPSNYVTKKEAKKMGWVASKGNLRDVCKGCSIGGDVYYIDHEKVLPLKEGRDYHECDIDYEGGTRNAKRLVYSNDGLIFYTDDHYKTFTLLYGDINE